MRAQRIEAAVFTKLAEGSDNPDEAIATAFLERPKDLVRIQRYVAAAQAAYYKAMRELEKLQKARAAAEYHAALIESMNAPRPAEPQPPIGFVSYNPPQPSPQAPAVTHHPLNPSELRAQART